MSKDIGLIADIGATNARFALADGQGIYEEKIFQCADYIDVSEAALAYLAYISHKYDRPSLASFAVAAPVEEGDFEMTNHPWRFSKSKISKDLNLKKLNLMNDFHAVALALPHLNKDDFFQIGQGKANEFGSKGVLGPGTGLGVSYLSHNGNKYVANSCEGGHVTMAAKTQREFDLFKILEKDYGHVSAERVCSGQGLQNIYEAIRVCDGRDELPLRSPEKISEMAIQKECEVCEEALNLMFVFLGRIAGNFALSANTRGGVYIAGGISAKLNQYFEKSSFREEFISKGRFKPYMDSIPTFIIKNPFIAFKGLQANVLDMDF